MSVEGRQTAFLRYALWLFLTTLFYLAVEISFNARLVAFILSVPDPDEIEAIETRGRLLFAAAVTLWIVGTLLMPRLVSASTSRLRALLIFLTTLLLCAVTVGTGIYIWQKQYFEQTTLRASADRTCTALYREALMRGVEAGAVPPPDLQRLGIGLQSPVRRTLLAAYPALSTFGDDVAAPPGDADWSAARAGLSYGIGTADHFYSGIYRQSLKEVEMAYQAYHSGSLTVADQMGRIHEAERTRWEEYQQGLRHADVDPLAVPWRARPAIIRRLHDEGLPIPLLWNGMDRAVFRTTFEAQYRKTLLESFDSKVRGRLGSFVPPGLDQAAFLAHPAVQSFWRQLVRAPETMTLTPALSPEQVARQVWSEARRLAPEEDISLIRGDRSGLLWHTGASMDASEALMFYTASVMALGLSTFGILLHSTKLVIMGLRVIRPWQRFRVLKSTAVIAVAVIVTALVSAPCLPPLSSVSTLALWMLAVADGRLDQLGILMRQYCAFGWV